MDSRLEILVYGTSGSTAVGSLDLFGDEPITLKMSVADIKDIKARKTTFSQSFTLPGTKNNNDLFNYLFEIGSDSLFNPKKKTPCQVLVDTLPVMTHGNLQLTAIAVDNQNSISYEVSIFDESEDFIDAIGALELTDLDFSELDHPWSFSGVTSTWARSEPTYFYPLIDYGIDISNGDNIDVSQMFPALQVKTIIDKIFTTFGYTYSSNFFNSSYFKNLYIPYNSSALTVQTQQFAIERLFQAQATLGASFNTTLRPQIANAGAPGGYYATTEQSLTTYPGTSGFGPRILFPNDSTGGNFDNGSLYDASLSEYVADTYSDSIFTVQLEYKTTAPSMIIWDEDSKTKVTFMRSLPCIGCVAGAGGYKFADDSHKNSTYGTNITKVFSTPPLNDLLGYRHGPPQPGESFWAEISFEVGGVWGTGGTATTVIYSANTYFYNSVTAKVFPNQIIKYNSWLPKKVKIIDFFNSIATMHNLYIDPDKANTKKLIIEPRADYYSAGVTKDWSGKLDVSTTVKENLISELQSKRIIFSYKDDSDYYNTDYKKVLSRTFGDEYFETGNDYAKGDKKIDVIFSPTPSVVVLNTGAISTVVDPFPTSEFVIPKIGKIESNTWNKTDSNIRILQKGDSTTVTLTSGNTWLFSGITQNSYPYLGMLDTPNSGGNYDLGFGTVEYEYFSLSAITNNNLVNRFYKTYLDQIIDKDAKLITCNLYLTPADIEAFKFSDSIWIQGINDDTGHYFIVNSIDYVPTSNATSKVELIKVKDKQFVASKVALKPGPRSIALQSIALGGANVTDTGSIGIGRSVTVSSPNSIAIGNNLSINGGSEESILIGSNSAIYGGAAKSFLMGDYNNTSSEKAFIHGDDNVISPLVGRIQMFGDDNAVGTSVTSAFIVGDNNTVLNDAVVIAFSGGGKTVNILGNSGVSTIRTQIFGDNNIIGNGTVGSHVTGNDNIIGSGITNTQVYGDRNYVGHTASGAHITGNGNHIASGLTNVQIMGNNITAVTSNAIHVDSVTTASLKFRSNAAATSYMELQIGDWNMDSTASVGITHGLSATEWKTIRQCSITIRNDADTNLFGVSPITGTGPDADAWMTLISSTIVGIARLTGGFFDSTTFDATGYNRGWITFWYTPD